MKIKDTLVKPTENTQSRGAREIIAEYNTHGKRLPCICR